MIRDGVPLAPPDVGSRKGRTLLKLLLLERGRVVPHDRIVEVLWGEGAPENADRLIASLVSRLRGVLGSAALEGGPAGYRFAPSPQFEVDLEEAERFVSQAEARLSAGESSLAVTAADRALGLLEDGPVLEDEPYAEWADEARAMGGRLLRRARRVNWVANLEVGDVRSALVAAEAAVQADPLDEEAHRAAMAAHHRGGRSAQALAAYESLRRVLADELGADPDPETQALHLAILREESTPGTAPTPAGSGAVLVEASDPGFVGREEELGLLAGLWRDAARGHPSLVLLAGEAGIGKTRLAAEVVRLAETTGGAVAQSRCYEAERSLFLQPVADAIRSIVLTAQPDVLREVAGLWAGTLAELVPEIGVILRPHGYERANPEIERRRSFEAVTSFIRSLAERSPVLLFLDDLHQAGSSTLELLHFLARRMARARVLILATVRVEESEEAAGRLAHVARRVDVGPLSGAAVTELARRMGGAHLGDRIVEITGGHALYVVEMLRAVAERAPESEDQPAPESLRTAVLERVLRTGPEVEELLRVAAVLGSSFELTVAANMLDLPVEEAGRRAERARAARVLVEAGTSFEFANDLIKEILYRTTPRPLLIVRHRRAASLLADNPEAVASHASAAGDWATALEAWLSAAGKAAARYANRDAEVLLDRAIEGATSLGDVAGEAWARLARGRAREALADYRSANEDHLAALELARTARDRALEMQALRELGGDVLVAMGRPTRDSLPYLEAALPIAREVGDVAAQVDVLSRMAVIWTNRLRFEVAHEHARSALELARASGDDRTLALALDGMKTVSAYAGDLDTLERLLPELERLLRGLGDLWRLHWAMFESSFPPMARGQWDRARGRIDEAIELTGRAGHTAFVPWYLAHHGWIERSRGRYGAALSLGRQATELADEIGHPWWTAFAETTLGWTLTELGAVDEAIEHLDRGLRSAEREGSESHVVRCVAHLSLAAQERREGERAGRLLDRAEALLGGITAPPGGAFLHGAHSYAAAARAALARGEAERAERLIAPILEVADRAGWREAAAEAALLAGRAVLAQGDVERGNELLRRSVAEAGDIGSPRVAWEAHARLADALSIRESPREADEHRSLARAIVRSLAQSIEDERYRASFVRSTRRTLGPARRPATRRY